MKLRNRKIQRSRSVSQEKKNVDELLSAKKRAKSKERTLGSKKSKISEDTSVLKVKDKSTVFKKRENSKERISVPKKRKSSKERISISNKSESSKEGTSISKKTKEGTSISKKTEKLKEKISEKILKELTEKQEVKALKSKRLTDSYLFWCLLAMARVYLAIAQNGYIHPDEFLQSLQVSAYDVLSYDGDKPWEFTSEKPIRSAVFTYLTSIPYVILKLLSPIIKSHFDVDILNPTVLIIVPRLFITFLSFICDFCVFKIASLCYVRPWQCVEVYAGSYIMLVFATRTFSNSIELILFSILLWRVCTSMVDSTKVIRRENVLQDLYETAESMSDKVKIVRFKRKLSSYNYVDSFAISVIATVGIFIRPTFLIFAFVPIAYWLQRGVVTRELSFYHFNLRCMSLFPGILIASVICILLDSLYYSKLTFLDVVDKLDYSSIVVTPINFVLYNMKPSNLAKHGTHPYFLHILVNIPLLHGVLGFLGLFSCVKYLHSLIFKRLIYKPKVYSMATMLLLSFIFPVSVLSCFSHQEPRFLLPTLIPLVILHSEMVSLYTMSKFKFTKHILFALWQLWNLGCLIFFGFLHQGGVVRSLQFVHSYVGTQPYNTEFHVAFSHMYPPPTFLLMRKIPIVGVTEDGRKFRVERGINVYDFGCSLKPAEVIAELIKINEKNRLKKSKCQDKSDPNCEDDNRNTSIILCITATISESLLNIAPKSVQFELITKISNHVSLESLPSFRIDENDKNCDRTCQIRGQVKKFAVDVFLVRFTNGIVNNSDKLNTVGRS